MKVARIGILQDKQTLENHWAYGLNVFSRYVGEVLAHAGIPFVWIDEMHHMLEKFYDIVIVAAAPNTDAAADMIWRYAEKGGIVVSFAGLNMMAKRFGCAKSEPVGKGYAELPREWGAAGSLRFLQAVPWIRQKQSDIPCREQGHVSHEPGSGQIAAALQQFTVGLGAIERWSIDVPGAIVGMQQGTMPVMDDGAPAADGSGAVNDGLWKAEDGLEMDWIHDRKQTETGALYFAFPYADLWREAVIAHLLWRMAEKGKPLPFTDYWPSGVEKVAMISHDSDRNLDEDAFTTLAALKELDIRSTWCMMKPGYSAWVYPHIKADHHELALHFNANINEGGKWTEADFRCQFEWLQDAVEGLITSNKNHFTRFEGWGDLFRWCEACGIAADQTRGPSKSGDAGFLFGTCHPYFPIAWANENNRFYNVLEMGFLSQDIPQFTDPGVVDPFLSGVERVRGVAHFLFHQGRIHSSIEVREAMLDVVKRAKERGFVFWTGRQINDWERARRAISIVGVDEQDTVIVKGSEGLDQAVMWRPLYPGEQAKAGEIVAKRFGLRCKRLSAASAEAARAMQQRA